MSDTVNAIGFRDRPLDSYLGGYTQVAADPTCLTTSGPANLDPPANCGMLREPHEARANHS